MLVLFVGWTSDYMMIRRVLQILAVVFIAVVVHSVWKGQSSKPLLPSPPATAAAVRSHVIDRTGVISPQDLPRFEDYMGWIMRESGVDVRFIFLPNSGGKAIEMLAANLMDELKIGGRTGQQRGLLVLYDMQGQHLKVEVGYGLEGSFPDAFVNYLVEDHAQMFFSSGDISLGLRLMLRLLQHRIREAVIGNDFDPRVLAKVRPLTHLSGGAGVSKTMRLGDGAADAPKVTPVDPLAFPAGRSPTDSYNAYLEWLSHWPLTSQVDLLTPGSRNYIASLHMSPAYAEFILLAEYGKTFEVIQRDDLALLYFTGTPFVSPHFFVKQDGRWRMDLEAEVRNTRERVGGAYTWDYRGQGDNFTLTFGDLLTDVKGYRRIRNGDNRALTIRGTF